MPTNDPANPGTAEPARRRRRSAGVLLYRRRDDGGLEVLLVHPGGPFWAKKDLGAWSIPKGEPGPGEDAAAAARRELEEETGIALGDETLVPLGEVRQPGGKTVEAWAVERDCDAARIRSNLFTLEWPPRSGRRVEFPEVDRAAWFDLEEAARRILAGQRPLLDRLGERVR
jgi:predicted NUDIX family NTP pyrophosphohydrolase